MGKIAAQLRREIQTALRQKVVSLNHLRKAQRQADVDPDLQQLIRAREQSPGADLISLVVMAGSMAAP